MKTGGRYLTTAQSRDYFTRFYLHQNGLLVLNFVRSRWNDPALMVSDSEAEQALRAAADKGLLFNKHFHAHQVGATGSRVSLGYRFQGWAEYLHGFTHGPWRGRQVWCFGSTAAGDLVGPYNRVTASLLTKERADGDWMRTRTNPLAYVIAPYEGSPWSDCTVVLVGSGSHGTWCNVATDRIEHDAWVAARGPDHFLPGMRLDGPLTLGAGEIAEYRVSITDPAAGAPKVRLPVEVFLETTAGYLPRTRVTADQDATFKLRALDLHPGDKIKLKAGWRNYTGAAELLVKVI